VWCRCAPPGRTLLSSRLVRRLLPLLILLLGALALYIDFMPGPKGLGDGSRFVVLSNIDAGFTQPLETKLGLDLKGGFSILYQAVPPNGGIPTSDQMQTIRTIMEDRVNGKVPGETIVTTQGNDRVLVEVPGAQNPGDIAALVGKTGSLEFVALPPADYGSNTATGTKAVPAKDEKIDPSLPVMFTGGDLDVSKVRARYDSTITPPGWVVDFGFKEPAATNFGTWSANNVGNYFAIVLDGQVVSAPVIQSAITGGSGFIQGSFNSASANDLATILEYGALPFAVHDIADSSIPATLGASFLNQTLLAGAIGILLVLAFMLIYYRLPGAVACLALGYYAVAVLAIFRIVPVTLTLAGVAGFVLSVGMAVDANILIFERTKEELRAGKTLIAATEAGFNRAWNSILDSNVSSLITASILYFGGSSTIKGFALVLIIGVATSMFTAVTVSRSLMRFVVKQKFAERAWLFGVSNEEFQARALPGRSRREARGRV
jgi:preprotein translocase subunit SecD